MAKDEIVVSTGGPPRPVTLDGLDDLAKDEVFTFQGKEYTIPAISQVTAEALTEFSQRLGSALDEEDTMEIIKFDIEYIAIAMDGGKATDKTMKMLRGWPKKVLGRLSLFISSSMMGPVEEDIPEEKKEEAKK